MNVMLIGGSGSLINNLIIKLNKEGHRVYLLTGSRYTHTPYQKVFEKYHFTYDCNCLSEIFESVNPDLTIYMGAFDTNYRWKEEEAEAVQYSAGLMNILMGYSMKNRGRFLYLSADAVYGQSYEEDISEEEPVSPAGVRGMAYAQAEELCESYRKNRGLDIITLRVDHLYSIPGTRRDIRDICGKMCLEALEKARITVEPEAYAALLYETDAIECIYRVGVCKKHQSALYNISSGQVFSAKALADMVKTAMGGDIQIVEQSGETGRRVLSNRLFESEFGSPFFCETPAIVQKIADHMRKNKRVFLTDEEEKISLSEKIRRKAGWLFHALFPFVENLIAFIPFFLLNNRAVGSEYFANLDFYLLYVLLFAIVYGQQQAFVSAVLAVIGYCFRQMYDRSGFEVLLDANTYVWVAQLFILGLVVGYMRDQVRKLKKESEEEKDFLSMQLSDIQDINTSNVRVKDALQVQIVNQNDSVGKIYSITSALDKYSPEEVLFYAAEVLGKLVKSKDVAIYSVSNASYARLFSSTSPKARMLGNSIRYTEMGEMYETLAGRKVFINRKLDERYPLMANAIYENEKMQMILMVWGIPWESMTLGQANQLVVISDLIQNAVLRANRYLAALEDRRYVEGTQMLDTEAFTSLLNAYVKAEKKGLTECAVLLIETVSGINKEMIALLNGKLRQTDYIGMLQDGRLCVLLANTNDKDAHYVIKRFAELGIQSSIME